MKYAAVGLVCFAAGWGCAWGYAQHTTVRHILRVSVWNYTRRK